MSFFDSGKDTESKSAALDRQHEEDMEALYNKRKNWGKSRDAYYSSDSHNFDINKNEDVLRAEENEVRRLQREQAQMLTDMDFGLSDIKTTRGKKNKNKQTQVEIDALLTPLTKDEKTKALLASSPELLTLLGQCETYYTHLQNDVRPLLKNIDNIKDIITITPILSFLKLREQLILSYSTCILYYLLLKLKNNYNNTDITHHPVMTSLLSLSTSLEKQDDAYNIISDKLSDIDLFTQQYELYNQRQQRKTTSSSKTKQTTTLTPPSTTDKDELAEYYRQQVAQSQAKQTINKIRRSSKPKHMVTLEESYVAEDQRRGAGQKILRNTGLRRQKSKKQIAFSGARQKMRRKHEKAMVHRRTIVKTYKGQNTENYSGESGGIKKNIIRSRKLG